MGRGVVATLLAALCATLVGFWFEGIYVPLWAALREMWRERDRAAVIAFLVVNALIVLYVAFLI